MKLNFYKYHGAGNDFILLDNREGLIMLSTEDVAHLCHRHYGIGADGLMLLEFAEGYDFRMVYYNSDGRESTMCGNGGRCITAFAQYLGIIKDTTHFMAIDGPHAAVIQKNGLISLQMHNVAGMEHYNAHTILNTGSPHYVKWVEDVDHVNVYDEGHAIRYSDEFKSGGINVNFVQQMADGKLWVRTYERGVENETLSCGTGVTAAAIAATMSETGQFQKQVLTPGGTLEVSFLKDRPDTAKDVVLTGPAAYVFSGIINI